VCSMQGVALGVAIAAVIFGFWRLKRRSLYLRLLKCAEKLHTQMMLDKRMGFHFQLPGIRSPIENVRAEIEKVNKSKWLWLNKDVGNSLEPVLVGALKVAEGSVKEITYSLFLLLAQREIQKFKGLVTDEAILVAVAFALAGLVIGLLGLWI
jgi:hypothetical protein